MLQKIPEESFHAKVQIPFNLQGGWREPVRIYKHIFKALPDTTYTTTFKSKYGFSALPEYISLTRNGPLGDEVLNFSCETLFEVSQENLITHWSYRGYDCY